MDMVAWGIQPFDYKMQDNKTSTDRSVVLKREIETAPKSVQRHIYRPRKGVKFWWEAFADDTDPFFDNLVLADIDEDCHHSVTQSMIGLHEDVVSKMKRIKRHPLKCNPIISDRPASYSFAPSEHSLPQVLPDLQQSSFTTSNTGLYKGCQDLPSFFLSPSSSSASLSETALQPDSAQQTSNKSYSACKPVPVEWTDTDCMQLKSGLFVRGNIYQRNVGSLVKESSQDLYIHRDSLCTNGLSNVSLPRPSRNIDNGQFPASSRVIDWAPPSPFSLRFSRLCPVMADSHSSLLERRGRTLRPLQIRKASLR